MMAPSPFEIEVDELTLAQAKRGSLPACERIFRAFQQPAYSVAVRICQCPETAQEITQEAFITVFRKLRQFRGDAPFWGWLRRVVINHTLSTMRRRPGSDELEFRDDRAVSAGEQEQVGLAMDLEAALASLCEEDRAVVWLHDVEGYGHREIADMFGMTESYSKTRLSRARARLRILLDRPRGEAPQENPDGRLAGGAGP